MKTSRSRRVQLGQQSNIHQNGWWDNRFCSSCGWWTRSALDCHIPLHISMMFSFTLPQCKNMMSISVSSLSISLQLASHFEVESATSAWLRWTTLVMCSQQQAWNQILRKWLQYMTGPHRQTSVTCEVSLGWLPTIDTTSHVLQIAAPLHHLTEKGATFWWDSASQTAEGAAHPGPNPYLPRVFADLRAFLSTDGCQCSWHWRGPRASGICSCLCQPILYPIRAQLQCHPVWMPSHQTVSPLPTGSPLLLAVGPRTATMTLSTKDGLFVSQMDIGYPGVRHDHHVS